jgi:hypothetical protein
MNEDTEKLGILYESIIVEMAYGLGPSAQSVTHDQLLDVIAAAEMDGTTTVGLTIISTPSNQRKRNNPYLPIHKMSQSNGLLGPDYPGSVNNQREREGKVGDFKAGPGWGERVSRSIIKGPNGINIAIQPTEMIKPPAPTYIGTEGANLRVLTPEEWGPFVPQYNRKYAQASQGVEKDVMMIKPALKNIVGATIQGTEYVVSDINPIQQEILQMARA